MNLLLLAPRRALRRRNRAARRRTSPPSPRGARRSRGDARCARACSAATSAPRRSSRWTRPRRCCGPCSTGRRRRAPASTWSSPSPAPRRSGAILAASASMGIDRLVLLAAARVEKSYLDSPVLQPDRIRKHLLDGLEQAQDTVLPEVHLEPRFRPFVEDRMDALLGPGERWLLHPGDEGPRSPSDDGSARPRHRTRGRLGPVRARAAPGARLSSRSGSVPARSAPRPSSPMRWGGPRGDAVQRPACTSARASASVGRPERRLAHHGSPPDHAHRRRALARRGAGDLRAPGQARHATTPRRRPRCSTSCCRSWKPRVDEAAARAIQHARRLRAPAAARSRKLFPGETLVIPTGHEKVRANDTYYRFRPGTDFYYLTGNLEPDCVLVLAAAGGRRPHATCSSSSPTPAAATRPSSPTANKGELWVGPRLGVPESQARFGVARVRAACPSSKDFLARSQGRRPGRAACCAASRAAVDGALPEQSDARQGSSPPRSPRCGCSRTRRRSRELSRGDRLHPARLRGRDPRPAQGATSEREVEGVFNLRARVEGNDVGYGTIAAVGRARLHPALDAATTAPLQEGRRCSCSTPASRATRSTPPTSPARCPISGKFTQGAAGDLRAGARARRPRRSSEVKPGNDFMEPEPRGDAGARRGPGAAGHPRRRGRGGAEGREPVLQALLAPQRQPHARPRRARLRAGAAGGLQVRQAQGRAWCSPSSRASTSRPTTSPCRAKYRGIGVRIEDDVVVTATGMQQPVRRHPQRGRRTSKRWMAKVWKSRGKRTRA